jgi:formylglycine-generating enzyme required for sulfatase activity
LGRYAWFGESITGEAHEVQQKLPNPLGLYDVHGNVLEWTKDWYAAYTSGTFVDPGELSKSSGGRVLRGGSFNNSPVSLRSARRVGVDPVLRGWGSGVRCVRVPPPH